jgi:hypothetical protein
LPAAIDAVARADDLDASLAAILAVAGDELAPTVAAIFVQVPDRSDLLLAASRGLDEPSIAGLTAGVSEPDHPFATAARERVGTFDRESLSAWRIRSGRSASRGRRRVHSRPRSASC